MSGISEIFSGPKKTNSVAPITPPSVTPEASKDEKLARIGRASLISTSAQGLLGNAQTGRKQLSV